MIDNLNHNLKQLNWLHNKTIQSIDYRRSKFFVNYDGVNDDNSLITEFLQLKNATEGILGRLTIMLSNSFELKEFANIISKNSDRISNYRYGNNNNSQFLTFQTLLGLSIQNKEKMLDACFEYNNLIANTSRLKTDPFFREMDLKTISIFDPTILSALTPKTKIIELNPRDNYKVISNENTFILRNDTSYSLYVSLMGYSKLNSKYYDIYKKDIPRGDTFRFESAKHSFCTAFITCLSFREQTVHYKINSNTEYSLFDKGIKDKILIRKI